VADSGYVYMQDGGRFRLQHRVVMERILGRPLHEDETIHHINGVRSDNRVPRTSSFGWEHPGAAFASKTPSIGPERS
jgi:hypothetical protein